MKRLFCVLMLFVLAFLLVFSSSAVWVSDGVYQPGFYAYTFSELGYYGTNANLILPFCVYWPNSETGKIDMFCGSYVLIQSTSDALTLLEFRASNDASSGRIIISPSGNCTNTLYPDQVYSFSDFVTLSPGVDFYSLGTYAPKLSTLFTVSAERTNTPGGGPGPSPDTNEKFNIFSSIRNLLNDSLFNGEAVAGSIEFNIATLISIICCVAIILLPFLACWSIVRLFIWR